MNKQTYTVRVEPRVDHLVHVNLQSYVLTLDAVSATAAIELARTHNNSLPDYQEYGARFIAKEVTK